MNAFVLHDVGDQSGVLRWGASAAAIVALHAALLALGLAWYTQHPLPGIAMPAIMVDMAPASSSPQPTPMDLAPGPVMQQADASPPPEPAKPQIVEEQIAPTPLQEKPEVEAPPEQKTQPTPLKPEPEPAKIVPEPKPAPVKPKVVRAEAKKPTETPPAPRNTAAPRAERQAPAASAISAGASAAVMASYNQLVAAHLQRFKEYPPGAKAAGEQGTARLSFSLGRAGQVLGSRLAGSSGHAALDGETLAMVRRAQPFPGFPPEMKQGSMSFNVPVQFSIR
jgi:periplasmic protein TonB